MPLTTRRDGQSEIYKALNDFARMSRNLHEQSAKSLLAAKDELIEVAKRYEQKLGFKLDRNAASQASGSKAQEQLLADLAAKITRLCDAAGGVSKADKVLQSLLFPEISTRSTSVDEAYTETYQWVFEEEICFGDWLKNAGGDKIFWIKGKPGSGKSTLMKFLVASDKTAQLLEAWTSGHRQVIASYFFWSSGTKLQKSQEGLLQTLLYQILRQVPDLIPVVAPDRWNDDSTSLAHPNPWSRDELSKAVQAVVAQSQTTVRFCFFIDGLDEFDGPPLNIVRDISRLATSPAVKICVSSRPENAFTNSYGQSLPMAQQLTLEDHTRGDIKTYVLGKMRGTGVLKPRSNKGQAMVHRLAQDIQKRAEGVFLWVVLIMHSVLKGFGEEDDISYIQKRLDELPNGLEELFERMLLRVDPVYKVESARTYLLALYSEETMAPQEFYFLKEDRDPGYTFRELQHCVKIDHARLRDEAVGRIKKWCKELLVIKRWDSYVGVEFLHRTVQDYLQTPEVQSKLRTAAGIKFDEAETMCRLNICWLKVWGYSKERDEVATFSGRGPYWLARSVMA